MASQKRDPKTERRVRRDNEVAEKFTFLEKLIHRVLPGRQVPAESGVRFAISSKAKDDGICLVFRVDDPDAPIVKVGPRPDYLVVHASKEACLMTIVEMKGTEPKNVEHGIEQIVTFYQLLRTEMATCLPGSWRRVQFQGILLTPFNSHINWKKIKDARKQGIAVFPLQYSHQAELYPFVSKPISRTTRYTHEKLPRQDPELNVVEQLVALGKQTQRIRDASFHERRGADEDTLFLNFRAPGTAGESHVSLSTTTRDAVLRFSPKDSALRTACNAHLKKHGLHCSAFRIE